MVVTHKLQFRPTDVWLDRNHWKGTAAIGYNACLMRSPLQPDPSLSVVSDPQRGYVGKFLTKYGDLCNAPAAQRAALVGWYEWLHEMQEEWVKISVKHPADFNQANTWNMFYQNEVRGSKQAGYPTLALYIETNGHLALRFDESQYLDLGVYQKGVWHDYIIQFVYTITTKGLCRVWQDGKLIFERVNVRTMALRGGTSLAALEDFGHTYQQYGGNVPGTRYFLAGDMTIGTTRADVESGYVPPDVPPDEPPAQTGDNTVELAFAIVGGTIILKELMKVK